MLLHSVARQFKERAWEPGAVDRIPGIAFMSCIVYGNSLCLSVLISKMQMIPPTPGLNYNLYAKRTEQYKK